MIALGNAVSLRTDVLLQLTNLRLFRFQAEASSWEAKQEYSYSGYRLWALLGLEVGG